MNNTYYFKDDHNKIFEVEYFDDDSDICWGTGFKNFKLGTAKDFRCSGKPFSRFLCYRDELEDQPVPEEIRIILEL